MCDIDKVNIHFDYIMNLFLFFLGKYFINLFPLVVIIFYISLVINLLPSEQHAFEEKKKVENKDGGVWRR